MQPSIIAIIVVAAALFVFALLMVFALVCDRMAFGRRYELNKNLKYFTAEDLGLSAQPVSLSGGLNGVLYSCGECAEKKDGVIVFCHGMGPGHIAYTTEIAYFCRAGYKVFAADSRGCNLSEGADIKGMYSGVKTAVEAVDFARSISENIYLIGHSWGAYSALCASYERKVSAVVAISAPDTPAKTGRCAAGRFISKPVALILQPFWWLVNIFRYGAKGNANAARRAEKNGTPTLIIHGDNDKVVNASCGVYYRAEGMNIYKLLVSGKAHNPYNTAEAEAWLKELSASLAGGCTDFTDFDFKAATEEDEEVMRAITDFIDKY